MYSTKDNLELNRIDIYELSNVIGFMNYNNIDNKQLVIEMPKFIDENQIITVDLQKTFMNAIKLKQDEFVKTYSNKQSLLDISFGLEVDMGDGTPIKKIVV